MNVEVGIWERCKLCEVCCECSWICYESKAKTTFLTPSGPRLDGANRSLAVATEVAFS
jgi:hypothetical protein